jgi:uncharacterized repeat protein (TIGR03803 family)
LVLDSKGDVYGTTYAGGNQGGQCGTVGCGTAFQLKPPTTKGGAWTEKILHRFQGSQDGVNPAAGLTFGNNGDLYGTTLTGGPGGGGGTVFRLTPPSNKSGTWKKAILYGFNGTGGGLDAESPVIFDSNGNLYGTTLDSGGTYYGIVFQLKPPKQKGDAWNFNMLYGFQAPPDGGQPAAGLVFDRAAICTARPRKAAPALAAASMVVGRCMRSHRRRSVFTLMFFVAVGTCCARSEVTRR